MKLTQQNRCDIFLRELQESISASRSYDEFGMYNLSGMHEGPAGYSMGMGMGTMSMGRAGRGYRRMRSSAPDLPSLVAIGFSNYFPWSACELNFMPSSLSMT